MNRTTNDTLARIAGYVLLTGTHANPYGARNVTAYILRQLQDEVARIESHPSPTEAPGRGDLPELRASIAMAERVLAMLEPLCPPV